ncbi:MAG: prolyl oligopeptidase family serine peptidase [Propionibacteriaceae bacterium]|nr:prolyl oligopeptidase family serine peptidase [Propionibacteriaceae bacterium]
MDFGEWPPTVSLDEVLTASDGMHQVRAVGTDVYWLANLAAEDGRGTILRWCSGAVTDLTPAANVRTRVNEYGGGTYDADGAGLAYADDSSKALYYLPADGQLRQLTSGDPRFRYAGLRLASDAGLLLAVREDYLTGGEPRTELVALSLSGGNDDGGTVLATGADFYGRPAYRESQVAWAQWNHPNMPWDQCEVWRARLGHEAVKVAGGVGVSALNPLFLADGRLAWLDDTSGYWNLALDDGTRFADAHDYCPPPWTLEEPPYAQLDETTIIATRFADGLGDLVRLDLATGQTEAFGLGLGEVESISCADGQCYLIALSPLHPPRLARLGDAGLVPLAGRETRVVPVSPRPFWFDGPAGRTHALLYSPADTDGPCPLLVRCHGGPTGMARAVLDLEVQFWVGRGIAVLDLNYSGSAGFGRAYRERLNGQWGVLDVADCVAAVGQLVADGVTDPRRVGICGGSAGGYTVLQSLVSSQVFTAGISRYGIGDLEALVADTHKFESRYLEGLIGPYPAQRQLYRDRSPIHHTDRLSTPMLILQGRDDAVVPLNQAEAMAAAVRGKGLPVALLVFDGEGHGFRQVANRRSSLLAQLSFLAQVWGFRPAEGLPPLTIENLG